SCSKRMGKNDLMKSCFSKQNSTISGNLYVNSLLFLLVSFILFMSQSNTQRKPSYFISNSQSFPEGIVVLAIGFMMFIESLLQLYPSIPTYKLSIFNQ